METGKKIVKYAYEALNEKKAEDISVLEVGTISTIADYFIIANGTSTPHVQALVAQVEEKLKNAGYFPRHIEGIRNTSWILMDYNDVIIHIFSKEDRQFYDLERIWRDGKVIAKEEL